MHDRDELHLELDLHIIGDMFDCGGDRIPGHERGVDDYAETFDLEVSLV